MKSFDAEFLQLQRALVAQGSHFETPEPFKQFDRPTENSRVKGEQLLRQGQVACLVLAGGQGTRLGHDLPKALVEVTPIRKKTLLQLICEKTKAASCFYKTSLQLAIMTSSANHKTIENYLIKNSYFGLDAGQVQLFVQDEAPFLNDHGDWIVDSSGAVVTGPDGNGHSLRKLMESGIGNQWKKQGIQYVTVLPIDNPLADPFDAALCGGHVLKNQDVTIKAIERNDPEEKVGVIVSRHGHVAVQEYSELPAHFEAPLAHIGLFCFSLSFIEKVAQVELPWHLARKNYKGQKIWKFERFLFDVLSHTQKAGVLVYLREDVYAPLKNLEGSHSLKSVQEALYAFDKRQITRLTQQTPPAHLFELDPALYYHQETQSVKALPFLDYYDTAGFWPVMT